MVSDSNLVKPLAGVRVIDASLLGPGALSALLADLGADVLKVESPSGDYVRQMSWPIIDGVSLLHWKCNRGKRGVALDLRQPEGVEIFLDLVRESDAVVVAMRPGALERRGIGFDKMLEINPRIVLCNISGYGATGPYRDMASHGIAYDTWAGVVAPVYDEQGRPYLSDHTSIGIHAGPLFGALAVVSGILSARETGTGMQFEIAQSDAAASFDWVRSEGFKAHEQPEDRVTGNKADNYKRRPPGMGGMKEAVRYQMYESADGHVLFMASEQEFWKNFCAGIDRMDLFEANPGSTYADHAIGNDELRATLAEIFKTRTSAEWIEFGQQAGTAIAPVNTPRTLPDDPQFRDRLGWLPREAHGTELLPSPIKVVGGELAPPRKAPVLDEHTDEVLSEILGLDADRLAQLRAGGVIGPKQDV